MDDLISRKAAIAVFGDVHPLDYNAQAYLSKIIALPPAQLGIIRCKDCKYSKLHIDEHGDHYYLCSVTAQRWLRWLTANDYCSHAVKREEGDE